MSVYVSLLLLRRWIITMKSMLICVFALLSVVPVDGQLRQQHSTPRSTKARMASTSTSSSRSSYFDIQDRTARKDLDRRNFVRGRNNTTTEDLNNGISIKPSTTAVIPITTSLQVSSSDMKSLKIKRFNVKREELIKYFAITGVQREDPTILNSTFHPNIYIESTPSYIFQSSSFQSITVLWDAFVSDENMVFFFQRYHALY